MNLSVKQCPQCKNEGIGPISLSEFATNKSASSGYQSWCKTHHRELNNRWCREHKEHRKKYSDSYVRTPRGWAVHARKRATREERAGPDGVHVSVELLESLVTNALKTGMVTLNTNKPDTASLDRIVSSKGYTPDNVQIVPRWYNMAKLHFTETELLEAVHRFGWRTDL